MSEEPEKNIVSKITFSNERLKHSSDVKLIIFRPTSTWTE